MVLGGARSGKKFRGDRGSLGIFGEAFPPECRGLGPQIESIDAARRV